MKRVSLVDYYPDEFFDLLKNAVRQVIAEQQLVQVPANSPPVFTLDVLTSKEVCGILRISAPTLIRLRREGKIQAKRVGGKVLFNKQTIQNFIKNGK